jgi:hypothetical protein
MNPVPVTISVKAGPPAVACDGVSAVTTGGPVEMVKDKLVDCPPPGAGLDTVTAAVPDCTRSLARMAAVTTDELTKVVTRALLFQFTTAPLTKFDPLIVSVKAGLPAVALLGCKEDSTGARFCVTDWTVKFAALEIPPPGAGLDTVTGNVPAVATSAALIVAVNCEALLYLVGRALPFHRTEEVVMKLPPLTVKVKLADPATMLDGDKEPMDGKGFPETTRFAALEVTFPFVTVTGKVPGCRISLARMSAWSVELLRKVVVRVLPFQETTACGRKLLPLTVKVKRAPPTTTLEGLSDVTTGAG